MGLAHQSCIPLRNSSEHPGRGKKKCGTKAELSNEGAGNPRQAEPDTISALGTVPWRAAAHPGKLGISRTSEACSPGGGRWFLNAESLIF